MFNTGNWYKMSVDTCIYVIYIVLLYDKTKLSESISSKLIIIGKLKYLVRYGIDSFRSFL